MAYDHDDTKEPRVDKQTLSGTNMKKNMIIDISKNVSGRYEIEQNSCFSESVPGKGMTGQERLI